MNVATAFNQDLFVSNAAQLSFFSPLLAEEAIEENILSQETVSIVVRTPKANKFAQKLFVQKFN